MSPSKTPLEQGLSNEKRDAGSMSLLAYPLSLHLKNDTARHELCSPFNLSKGFNPGTGSYAYDPNGNLTTDPYKALTIAYNHLNLPKLMTFTTEAGSNTIEVLYDAAGTKLRKTVKTGTTVNYTQDYIAGIEYRDGAREAIYTTEGRVFYTSPTTTRYEYSIKDHLGNTRLTFTDKNANGVVDVTASPSTNEILQENHYYPFGLNTEGPWMNDASLDNRYQYNRTELNDDFGLNLILTSFRCYDPALGRWAQTDPLVGMAMCLSPYNYGFNDPVYWSDPKGLLSNPGFSSDVWDMIADAWHSTPNGSSSHYEYVYNQYAGEEVGREYIENGVKIQYKGAYIRKQSKVDIKSLPLLAQSGQSPKQTAPFSVWEEIWNSTFVRSKIPDFVSIGVGGNAIAWTGFTGSIELNWVTRGPEASLMPIGTTTVGGGTGYSISATFNIGGQTFTGDVSDIKRSMLQTDSRNGDLPTVWVSPAFAEGVKAGLTGTATKLGNGGSLIGGVLNLGGGIPAGPAPVNWAAGVSNTYFLIK